MAAFFVENPKSPLFENGKVYVTYGFMDPDYGGVHNGLDCTPGPMLSDYVVAIADGIVEYTKTNVISTVNSAYHAEALGNNVKIDHGDGMVSRYAHLAHGSISVKAGQKVKKGQRIGYMGKTGYTFGPHLHFEIYANGNRIDPLPYITGERSLISGGNWTEEKFFYRSLGKAAIRTLPDKSGAISARCSKDLYYPIQSRNDKWLVHATNGLYSMYYDDGQLFAKDRPYITMRTDAVLNVRNQPSELSAKIGVLPRDTVVYVVKNSEYKSKNYTWVTILYNGGFFYVAKDFLK
jgi:hypothetical protein